MILKYKSRKQKFNQSKMNLSKPIKMIQKLSKDNLKFSKRRTWCSQKDIEWIINLMSMTIHSKSKNRTLIIWKNKKCISLINSKRIYPKTKSTTDLFKWKTTLRNLGNPPPSKITMVMVYLTLRIWAQTIRSRTTKNLLTSCLKTIL